MSEIMRRRATTVSHRLLISNYAPNRSFSKSLHYHLNNFVNSFQQLISYYETHQTKNSKARLPPEVNRILYVRNLPFKITADELYGIFGKYGAVYQIRLGEKSSDKRGTAFVVYEDIYDAKAAVDHLSGFNVGGRYLVVLYYQPAKFQKRQDAEEKKKEIEELRRQIKVKKAALAAGEDVGF